MASCSRICCRSEWDFAWPRWAPTPAFAGYASSLGFDRRLLKKGASALAWVGVTAHTAYLAARWFAAGQVEILARERTGEVLSSADRLWYLISHRPSPISSTR